MKLASLFLAGGGGDKAYGGHQQSKGLFHVLVFICGGINGVLPFVSCNNAYRVKRCQNDKEIGFAVRTWFRLLIGFLNKKGKFWGRCIGC
ncbi:hypothetical protein MKQ70_08145 [Chitinophaga sedimenti]|uniref:hypothetical protein n=1 Tax=Chitinophaga sedimenti TaxID=2033606 RepID=UPI002005E3C6|nr:hypothetical protein [Chitinophaga sedimenti]MCK7554976.1 hypothetical protein [Chitinophaga sedimenti]